MGGAPSHPSDRRPRRGVSPISRLATIELQLIMRASSARGIIRLARCARHFQQAAQDPFVWRECTLTLTKLPQSLPASFPAYSPLLRVSVCPVLPPTPHSRIDPAALDRLLRMSSAVSIRCFDWSLMSQHQLALDDWTRVLRSASMQSLRSVCLTRYYDVAHCFELDPELLSALRGLPLLETLRLGVVQFERWDDDSIDLPPTLTELELRQPLYTRRPFVSLSCVSRCARLRTLELGLPIVPLFQFERLWTDFASAGLERLHLDQLPQIVAQSALDAFARAMLQLPCLSEVHLSRCVQPQKLIDAAFDAPALRRIIVEAELSHLDPFANCAKITVLLKSLRSALPLHPLVFAELRMPRLDRKPSREEREYAEDARAQIAASRELQAVGPRFKLSETIVRNAIR